MSLGMFLSIDPRGEWSERKARIVLAIINAESKEHGIVFQAIEVTCMQHVHKRFILVAHCVKHEMPIDYNNMCPQCARSLHR